MKLVGLMRTIDLQSIAMGIGVAGLSFVVLGTVSALWENPLFIRMTPVGGFEIAFLAALSVSSLSDPGADPGASGADDLDGDGYVHVRLLPRPECSPTPVCLRNGPDASSRGRFLPDGVEQRTV